MSLTKKPVLMRIVEKGVKARLDFFATMLGLTDEEAKFIPLFLDASLPSSKVYLSPIIITDWLNYESNQHDDQLYARLQSHFVEHVDYEEVKANHPLVKAYQKAEKVVFNNRKRHFAVTGDTLKGLLLICNIAKGQAMRRCFIKVRAFCSPAHFAQVQTFLVNDATRIINEKNDEISDLEDEKRLHKSMIKDLEGRARPYPKRYKPNGDFYCDDPKEYIITPASEYACYPMD